MVSCRLATYSSTDAGVRRCSPPHHAGDAVDLVGSVQGKHTQQQSGEAGLHTCLQHDGNAGRRRREPVEQRLVTARVDVGHPGGDGGAGDLRAEPL